MASIKYYMSLHLINYIIYMEAKVLNMSTQYSQKGQNIKWEISFMLQKIN